MDDAVSTRSYKLDSNGEAETVDMTVEEIAAVQERGKTLFQKLKDMDCTTAQFEAAIKENNLDGSDNTYTDGYYLQKDLNYAELSSDFSYFSDIITAMSSMENGDIVSIVTDNAGYHIIMKYAPTPQAYEIEANAVWFKNFTSGLIEKLFLAECHKLFPEMIVNEKVLADAKDIKKLGVNASF